MKLKHLATNRRQTHDNHVCPSTLQLKTPCTLQMQMRLLGLHTITEAQKARMLAEADFWFRFRFKCSRPCWQMQTFWKCGFCAEAAFISAKLART